MMPEPLGASRGDAPRRARGVWMGLILFLALTFALSWLVEWLLIRRAASPRGLIFLLMWIPGLVSLGLRLVLREGFLDVSFRFSGLDGLRAVLLGCAFPVAVGVLAYGGAWASGLAEFVPSDIYGNPAPPPPLWGFLLLVGRALTWGLAVNALFAAGEEIGWRGYLISRLADAKVRFPGLLSGAIWCVWHFPLILCAPRGTLGQKVLDAMLFTAAILPVACVMAWLRFGTGSVWPAIALHASWNSVILEAFDPSARYDPAVPWLGEAGILVAGATLLLALWLSRARWARRAGIQVFPERPPGREEGAP